MKPHPIPILVLAVLAFARTAAAGDKVEVCHLPPGDPDSFHTLLVSVNAEAAHVDHGDLLGTCTEHLDTLCSDGDACTIDTDGAVCLDHPRAPVDCDDGDEATADDCDPTDGCLNVPDAGQCSDGIDGDGDGLVDCTDPDCADVCVAPECAEVSVSAFYAGCGLTATDFTRGTQSTYALGGVTTDGCAPSATKLLNGWRIECDCSVTRVDYVIAIGSRGTPIRTVSCTADLPDFTWETCTSCE